MLNQTMPRIFAGMAALLALSLTAPAQAAPWTTIGSTGVVDDADLALFDFALGEARVKSTAAAGSVLNLRYNIVALDGFSGLNQVVWRVRFRDNGAGARVRLFLRQGNFTGTTSALATFDSDSYPAAPGYQTHSTCIGVNWDFDNGPFYIDAELTKSGASGTPALSAVLLNNANCAP